MHLEQTWNLLAVWVHKNNQGIFYVFHTLRIITSRRWTLVSLPSQFKSIIHGGFRILTTSALTWYSYTVIRGKNGWCQSCNTCASGAIGKLCRILWIQPMPDSISSCFKTGLSINFWNKQTVTWDGVNWFPWIFLSKALCQKTIFQITKWREHHMHSYNFHHPM